MYIPLRVFSQFSVGFGAVQTQDIVSYCKENDVPAIAIADRDSLGGAMTISKDLTAKGIQPIIGLTAQLQAHGLSGDIVLIAMSNAGYRAILRVANSWNTADTKVAPTLTQLTALLGDGAGDVLALTAGDTGLVQILIEARKNARSVLEGLKDLFADRLYVEIQRDAKGAAPVEAQLREMADQLEIPLVASNEAHYATADMRSAHDAFLCISDKTYLAEASRRHAIEGRYLVSPKDMIARFSDLPEAIANTEQVARRASFVLETTPPRLPAFPTENGMTEEEMLRSLAEKGLERRLAAMPAIGANDSTSYEARLEYELDTIIKMGFAGYFLIVADFIGWAKSQGIPVGPGRGSGAGSLVAYALGITDIDPLPFSLLFERFLNPDRVSMPDFDVDFCQMRRDEVIDYVRQRYGNDRVAHIAAFGTLQPRAVVRDVGRVMQIPYPVVDRYAKMIPQNASNPISLTQAMESEGLAEELACADGDIRALFSTAIRLEGLYRHVSTHAAGMIISDQPVADLVPVHLDQNGKLCTSFEMKAVEAAGLVKFDFLGLKNLDIIDGSLDFIERATGTRLDLDALQFQDPETYAKLASGDGFAVFQLESSGMRQAMKDLRIANIEELIALISLYRPGPMDQIKTYAAVKHGVQGVQYAHDETRAVLEPTNGVTIYQEQVMELAKRLAGYTLGEADLLRRAMGKKIQSEMDRQRARFIEGAEAGWVEVTLETGEVRRLHSLTRLPALDGSGRPVTLQEALDQDLDVAI
jgi:DNA polymerase III subunit alpha